MIEIVQMFDGSFAVCVGKGVVAFGLRTYEQAQDIRRACELNVLGFEKVEKRFGRWEGQRSCHHDLRK